MALMCSQFSVNLENICIFYHLSFLSEEAAASSPSKGVLNWLFKTMYLVCHVAIAICLCRCCGFGTVCLVLLKDTIEQLCTDALLPSL